MILYYAMLYYTKLYTIYYILNNIYYVLCTMVWSGLVWSDLIWSGLVWSGLEAARKPYPPPQDPPKKGAYMTTSVNYIDRNRHSRLPVQALHL